MAHLATRQNVLLSSLILIILCFVLYNTFGPFDIELWPHSSHKTQQWDQSKDLLLVHVVFRHGARTPADTYPTDPHINETFQPYGWGQITNNGKRDLYKTGQWLRYRYAKFLGAEYIPDLVWAQTTGVTRTKISMAMVLAGLFPPAGTSLEWNPKLNWQPIPIESEKLEEDSLLLVRTPCPRYYEALAEVFRLAEVQKTLNENEKLFNELTNLTGSAVKTPDDIQSLYSTLRAESEYGLKLPEWTSNYYPEQLINMAEMSYIYNVYTTELQKLKGGPFIRKMIAEQEQKKMGTLKPENRKIFMYTGHDSTIVNILSSLRVWEKQLPNYGIMALFELVRDKITGQIGIQMYLKSDAKSAAIPLTLPGCDHFCPFTEFISKINDVLLGNPTEDCKAKDENFSTPSPSGP